MWCVRCHHTLGRNEISQIISLFFAGYNNCNATSLLSSEKRTVTKSEKRTDRTTKMLVTILLLFLITEFPQGILGLLSVILGRCFFRTCYYLWGEVMDILALLNGAINFILYCSMSRQFRTNFASLFKPRVLRKWSTPASQTDVQSTYVWYKPKNAITLRSVLNISSPRNIPTVSQECVWCVTNSSDQTIPTFISHGACRERFYATRLLTFWRRIFF
jgi:hypothetical protein